jgi:hypothetical protein
MYEYPPKKRPDWISEPPITFRLCRTGVLGPAVVLKLDSRPISRVEVGFQGGRIYLYGLLREQRVINGEKCEICSVRKVGVRAGVDWSRIDDQTMD